MRPLKLLIVEDSPEDFRVTRRALQRSGVTLNISHCETGDDALSYLQRDPDDRPDLILLDLNLPGTDGREVLRRVSSDDELCSIPVVVLTTSSSTKDLSDCYRYGASSYIVKPVDLPKFMKMMSVFAHYWSTVVTVPSAKLYG